MILSLPYLSTIPPRGGKSGIVHNQGMVGIVNNRIKKELKVEILILGGMGGFGVMGTMADEYGIT